MKEPEQKAHVSGIFTPRARLTAVGKRALDWIIKIQGPGLGRADEPELFEASSDFLEADEILEDEDLSGRQAIPTKTPKSDDRARGNWFWYPVQSRPERKSGVIIHAPRKRETRKPRLCTSCSWAKSTAINCRSVEKRIMSRPKMVGFWRPTTQRRRS